MPQAPDWSMRVPTRTNLATRVRRRGSAAWSSPAALERRCESCGTSVIGQPYTIAPRVERGAGGIFRAAANAMWNLSLLCGSAASPGGCYLLREQRDPATHDRGIWLWPWENPLLAPVQVFDPTGAANPRVAERRGDLRLRGAWPAGPPIRRERTGDPGPIWCERASSAEHDHASWRRTTANATATSPAASARKMTVSMDWNAQ